MGTSSGELWKYSKFETYQEFMSIYGNLQEFWGINWKFGEIYKLYHIQT